MGRHEKHISGDSFDRQWNESARRGRERAARGEGPWATDAYLSEVARARQRDAEARKQDSEGCGKATLFLLGTLGGVAWFLSETVGRAL